MESSCLTLWNLFIFSSVHLRDSFVVACEKDIHRKNLDKNTVRSVGENNVLQCSCLVLDPGNISKTYVVLFLVTGLNPFLCHSLVHSFIFFIYSFTEFSYIPSAGR